MTALWQVLVALAGLLGAGVAVFKIRPERTNIIVTAAQGAVVVQSGVIDDLREQIEYLEQRQDAQGERMSQLTIERDRLRLERDQLRRRVEHLEQVVRDAGLETDPKGERP